VSGIGFKERHASAPHLPYGYCFKCTYVGVFNECTVSAALSQSIFISFQNTEDKKDFKAPRKTRELWKLPHQQQQQVCALLCQLDRVGQDRIGSSPWLDRPFLVKLCQKAKFGSFSPTISPFWELKVVLL
jgi:hypothetical protein